MTKDELVRKIAVTTGLNLTQSADAVNAYHDHVIHALWKGGQVKLMNFGTFKTHKTKARDGRDPRNGNPIKIPARKRAKFVPSPNFHNVV